MPEMTEGQRAAAESRGKVIVSASAGSGKTFVMIEKLTRAIEEGADLDNVLAVTFTKKAAAQMKEKLRSSLVKRVENANGKLKARLKTQIAKIPTADISTIHAFCSRLIKTYFYALDLDGGFEIMSEDDFAAADLQKRAMDNLFERLYGENDGEFLHLLKCFRRKRSDADFRALILESYFKARTVANYEKILGDTSSLYCEEGFERVCGQLKKIYASKFRALAADVRHFAENFPKTANAETYNKIFGEMISVLNLAGECDIFDPIPPICQTTKPRKESEEDKPAGELYKAFRQTLARRYSAVREGLCDRQTELERFLASGKTATAFANLLLAFDGEYFALKKDENKLDYNDLEHLTLRLFGNKEISSEICAKYKYVFVDEYQDVNPVQEKIISCLGEETFMVGDVKQAIYGFRGSKSLFFAEKFNRFEGGEGTALRLSGNFRSAVKVVDFVNRLFSSVMTEESCGLDYKINSRMTASGDYPADCGEAELCIFGKDEKEEGGSLPVYSVMNDSRTSPHSREGLAVLQLVEKALSSTHYDLASGKYVNTLPGDICILTRKGKNGSAEEIVRALRDAGYPVAGAQEGNICELPEVKEMLDILSFIDNAEQDIPLATAMLSPAGDFSADELAAVRIFSAQEKKLSFRGCVAAYIKRGKGTLQAKLESFCRKAERWRDLAQILTAGELIDKILADSGLEAVYAAGGGERLKNVLRLAAEGEKLSLPAFLSRIKAGGYYIPAPSAAPAGSIKIMTMHASKGLEFPVVILADICRTFKGRDNEEMMFSEVFGFAPKLYDPENMLVYPTVLRRALKLNAAREDLKNELNLFYVACTRAMCKLYVLASEIKKYSPYEASEAKCYAQTFDMGSFPAVTLEPRGEIEKAGTPAALPEPDGELVESISSRFMRPYPFGDSVELPVKSSASAILRSMREDEPYSAERCLFPEENETGAERGTAYHRFLELCDFSVKGAGEIAAETERFVREGKLTAEAAALLSANELAEILAMPVFSFKEGTELYREREFLCRLPANSIFPTKAEDFVLVQGAIDLLAADGDGVRIIDYKYSKKTDQRIREIYSPQLALYKKAVSLIMKIPEESIGAAIVNIFRKSYMVLD